MGLRISSPVFVGRSAELRQLQVALDDARSGAVRTIIVGGEAGVGKTRLLAEFRGRAEAHGLRFLEGGCVDLGDAARPYDPLVGALRPWLRGLPSEEFDRIVGPARSALRHLIPDLGLESDDEPAGDASSAQSAFYLQVLGLIERIAADVGTVIALEDLHWSDRSTRDMLRFLVRNLTDGRVVLLGTYRTDELHERHPFLNLLAELGRSPQVERIQLEPLRGGTGRTRCRRRTSAPPPVPRRATRAGRGARRVP